MHRSPPLPTILPRTGGEVNRKDEFRSWESKTYKKYLVRLRADEDRELIEFIEQNKDSYGTTELFRAGLEKLKSEQRK